MVASLEFTTGVSVTADPAGAWSQLDAQIQAALEAEVVRMLAICGRTR